MAIIKRLVSIKMGAGLTKLQAVCAVAGALGISRRMVIKAIKS